VGKYDLLREHLRTRGSRVVMTFDEIANLVGGLPQSAYTYPVWWNNDDPTHSHSRSWGDAGYDADPDVAARTVTFNRR
jgi:hypothetical protein